jgi:hypothetical protein
LVYTFKSIWVGKSLFEPLVLDGLIELTRASGEITHLHTREGGLNMPSTVRSKLLHNNHLHRRTFFKIAAISTATTALGMVPGWHLAYAAALTKAQREKLTPDDVIALMKKGNERFRHGKESPHDYLAQQKVSAKGQYPAAVILSCIDSRAPAETIMDLGIGD